jgi:hypothetical protein
MSGFMGYDGAGESAINIETLVDSDGDWSILRVNGREICKKHSLNAYDVLEQLELMGYIKWNHYSVEDGKLDEKEFGEWLQDPEIKDWIKDYLEEIAPYVNREED